GVESPRGTVAGKPEDPEDRSPNEGHGTQLHRHTGPVRQAVPKPNAPEECDGPNQGRGRAAADPVVFHGMTHSCLRMTANHTFGPPPETAPAVNSGCTSQRTNWTDPPPQPSAKARYSSCRDTRRGPSFPGSSSLKHIRNSRPPGSRT